MAWSTATAPAAEGRRPDPPPQDTCSAPRSRRGARSPLLDEAVDHPLLARLLEGDGQLGALDHGDLAVAELDVEHPVAALVEARAGVGVGGGDQAAFALDHLAAGGAAGGAPVGGAVLRPLPARRGIAGAGEHRLVVEARLGLAHARAAAVIAGLRR